MTASVIGLDLGSSTSFVAKVENGGVVLLTNELNSRCTPTIISLPSSERGVRMVGASAESHLVTQPNSSVAEVTGLLGASSVDLRGHRDAAKLDTSSGNAKIGVKLLYQGRSKIFLPEQLVATVLKHLKMIVTEDAENKIDSQNNYYVLSVPNYFTDVERNALLDAAKIAQINVIHLTNDITAAALAYGYFQKNLPNAALSANDMSSYTVPVADLRISAPPISERPRLVAFIDFGHSGIQTGIVGFSADGLKVMTTQTDRSIGGRDLDHRLARHFMDLFNLQHKSKGVRLRPDTHPKVYAKLLSVAEKMKRQMSANRNVLPVVVECLYDDFDFNAEISRDVFEQLCSDLFEKSRNCFVRLLQRARIEPGSLHSVEILGGSSRIPLFKTIVEDVFHLAPSTTLNADEAVARGCALMCALNTKIFKVKPFQVIDTVHYSTQVKYACVVPEGSSFPLVAASQFNSTSHSASAALHTQTKRVFTKNCKTSASMRAYLELEDLPHGNTLALEYCAEDQEEEGNSDCEDLRALTKPLIAIYNFEHDVLPREGDKLQLEFSEESGGIVRMTSAKLVQTAKRVKYDESNVRERNVRFSEIRVGGLTGSQIQTCIDEEAQMEEFDIKERTREETKNRLEETTFALREELENLDDVIRNEEAWSIVAKFVRDLSNEFETDRYENSPVDLYRNTLEEVQKKKTVFMVWLQRFNQKRELENMRNGMVRR